MIEQIAEISFYRELYEIERSRKNQIDTSVQFPTTVLTLLIGAFYYVVNSDNLEGLNSQSFLYKVVIGILIFIFIFSIVMTIFFLLIMFHNIKDKYNYLPSPKSLKKRQLLLYEHFIKNHSELKSKERKKEAIKYSKAEFNKEILKYYIDCANNNQIINDRRLKEYYYTRKSLMISIISLILIVAIILSQNI